MPPRIELLVVDMDNTLYDWVEFFVPAVYEMVAMAATIIGVEQEILLDDLKAVNELKSSSEYPFGLLETRSVDQKLGDLTLADRYTKLLPAFDTFDRVRVQHLRLYPGVRATLEAIRKAGVPVVAHTESSTVNIESRVRLLSLDSLLNGIYAATFEGGPHPLGGKTTKSTPRSIFRSLSIGVHKPDPRVAKAIAEDWSVSTSDSLYLGDSLTRDVAMARSAGMHTAWARYGTIHSDGYWDRLVRISHWTASSVAEHASTKAETEELRPEVTLNAFPELLEYFRFGKQS